MISYSRFGDLRKINTMYETMIAAPTMYVEPVRSDFLYKFNKVDPETGKEFDEKLRNIQCELVVNIATHGVATKETLEIYNAISEARSYANLRMFHPLRTNGLEQTSSRGGGASSERSGVSGAEGTVIKGASSSRRLASSSSMSTSDICELISSSK